MNIFFTDFTKSDRHTMRLSKRPTYMILSLQNIEIVEPLQKIDDKIRQHPVANAIVLMLHHLNQRRSAGIFLSDLMKFFLINRTAICDKHIN